MFKMVIRKHLNSDIKFDIFCVLFYLLNCPSIVVCIMQIHTFILNIMNN